MQLTPLPAPPAFDNSEWQDLTEPMSSVLHWQSEVWNQPPPSLPSIRGGTSTSGSSKSLGGDIPSRPHSSATVTAGAAISRPPSTLMRAANKVRSAARLVVPDCIAEGLSMAEVIRQVTNGLSIKFIAVFGMTGAGKSSAIRLLTGMDVHVAHGISAGTSSFAMFPATIEGQRYIFIDTPGFNDSDPSRTDIDVFQEILKWFETMSPYCDLAGLLYVYDMMNPRFTGSADLILKMISALCGEEYFRNVTILTTKWSQVGPGIHTAVVNSQEAELIKGPWKEMIAGGARVHRHRGLIDLEIVPPEFKAVVDAQRKIEQDDVREMIRFYRTSETKVAPQIQHELRSGTEVMRTAAASVLLRFRGLDIQQNEDNADAHSLILLQPRPESTIEDVTALESRYAYMPGYFPDRQENPARRSTRRHPPDGLPRLLGGSPLSWWATFCNAIFAFLTGS